MRLRASFPVLFVSEGFTASPACLPRTFVCNSYGDLRGCLFPRRNEAASLAVVTTWRCVFRLALYKQVHEKIMKREETKKQDMAYGYTHAADAEQARREDMERKLALLNRSKAYKQQLQSQMQLDASRRKEALMTDVEKKINKNLLDKVEEYKKLNAIIS